MGLLFPVPACLCGTYLYSLHLFSSSTRRGLADAPCPCVPSVHCYMGQVLLASMNGLTAIEHGAPMGPDFFTTRQHAIRAFGVISVLSVTGIWFKFNFLLFFYRLGSLLSKYRYWWWVGSIFNLCCGACCLLLLQCQCMFGDIDTLFRQCAMDSTARYTSIHVPMTAVLDIVCDIASESSPLCQLRLSRREEHMC